MIDPTWRSYIYCLPDGRNEIAFRVSPDRALRLLKFYVAEELAEREQQAALEPKFPDEAL